MSSDAETHGNSEIEISRTARTRRPQFKCERFRSEMASRDNPPNDDRVSPPPAAMFSLVMLAATPGGDAYTFAELKQMFENAGFSQNEIIPLQPMPQHLIVSER